MDANDAAEAYDAEFARKQEAYLALRRKPRILTLGFAFSVAMPVFIGAATAALMKNSYPNISAPLAFGAFVSGYTFLRIKSLLIFAVRIYQRFSPDDVRGACLFIPSCSDYAILALEKQGALIGLIKAVRRLLRCRAPNGGEDYP